MVSSTRLFTSIGRCNDHKNVLSLCTKTMFLRDRHATLPQKKEKKQKMKSKHHKVRFIEPKSNISV